MKASDRVTFNGKPQDRLTAERLRSAEMMLRSKRFGSETSGMTCLQGIGGAPKSGGTHSTGGCSDTTDYNWKNRQYVGRLLGGADYHRPNNWDLVGGGAHIHWNTIGVSYAAASAKRQWTSYYAGRNALRNNARDTGPRLATKPLFVAPWTDRGKRGVYYTLKNVITRTEGSDKTKSLGAVAKGGKFTVVAVVNSGGVLWAINVDGKHLRKFDLTMTKPKASTPTKPKPVPVPKPVLVPDDKWWAIKKTLWGLDKADGKQLYERKPGYILHTTAYSIVNKIKWLVTSHGTWYPTPNMMPLDKPKPPSAKTLTLTVGTINVIRWRIGTKDLRKGVVAKKGLDYNPDRAKGIAKMAVKMGVSTFTTSESGQYADADLLSKNLGPGWKNVLHGDAAGDITSAVHWNSNFKMLAEGRISSGNAAEVANHNWGTYALLQDLTGSDVIFMNVGYHAEYRARGVRDASKYDRLREKHTRVLVSESEKIASAAATKYNVKVVPIVFFGDFNQDKDDYYDGPGKAMAAYGYVDFEVVTTSMSGPETTYNELDPKKVNGRRLDRGFAKRGTKMGATKTVSGYPDTDHNGVSTEITLTNEK